MTKKRATIYDLARELGVSPSYVSKALSGHRSVSEKVKIKVNDAATKLNYRHNSHAANLRQGSTKTLGVIVPHVNQSFFSEAIAGIEEACYENNHSLIICQSHESYERECQLIDTLIHQNVDCIIISVAAETKSAGHLETISKHQVALIQFDRYIDGFESCKVLNDNAEASYKVVKQMVKEGYRKIAFLGGPDHLTTFKLRKDGFLKAIKNEKLKIPDNYIVDDVLDQQQALEAAKTLLSFKVRPDAILTVSDHQSLAVLKVAQALGISVPRQLGIFGFANEGFTDLIRPSLSSVDQKSKELGRLAADLYFKKTGSSKTASLLNETVFVNSKIISRESSQKIRRPAE